MQVTTISATYERKFNLENYNSATVAATMWANLDMESHLDENGQVVKMQAESASEAFLKLFEMCKEQVRLQSIPVLKPQMKLILEQLQHVKLDQDGLKGILTSLIANGSVTVKIGYPEDDKPDEPKPAPAPAQAQPAPEPQPTHQVLPQSTAGLAHQMNQEMDKKYQGQQKPATLKSTGTTTKKQEKGGA